MTLSYLAHVLTEWVRAHLSLSLHFVVTQCIKHCHVWQVTMMQPSFSAVLGCRGSINISYQVFSQLWSQTKKHSGDKMLLSICLLLSMTFLSVTSFPFSESQKASDHMHFSLSELNFHCSLSRLTNVNLFLSKDISKCAKDTSKCISSSTTCCKCCTKEMSFTILLFFLNIIMKYVIPCSHSLLVLTEDCQQGLIFLCTKQNLLCQYNTDVPAILMHSNSVYQSNHG